MYTRLLLVSIIFLLSCTNSDLKNKYKILTEKIKTNQEKIKQLNFIYQKEKQDGAKEKATQLRKEIFILHNQNAEFFEDQKKIRRKRDNNIFEK